MKRTLLAGTGAVVVLLVGILLVQSAAASEGDELAVRKAVDEFYLALNAMFQGELEPMTEIWSHADDVTYMGPTGGLQVGWQDVSKDWAAQAALNLGGEVHPKDLHITVGRDLASVSNVEVGENTGPNGEVIRVEIRATSLFRKEAGSWKMIGHHTDLLPDLEK